MNTVDRLVGFFDPIAGLRRAQARKLLASYDAAEPSRLRRLFKGGKTPNEMTQRAAMPLREHARYLERNHDIARGVLNTLVANIVGPKGIGIEPQPMRADGTVNAEYAERLLHLYRDWCRLPEVTHRHHFARVQRLMARSWLRDGEVFAQRLMGKVPYLDHGTEVPLSLEMFEADLVPIDYSNGDRIRQGMECNAWGKPVAYFAYRNSLDSLIRVPTSADLKRLTYDNVYHPAFIDRIGQLRGVSIFASVITRLEDIKDYEESERVAAKIAAMLTAYVKKGTPDLYDGHREGAPPEREIRFSPGMVLDNLGPGEEIGLVDSKRPNVNLLPFRQGQLRAVSAGVGASYSSVSRDYDGTYSAQRQELVEQWVHYAVLTDDFVGQFVQPVWEDFVLAAHLSGLAPIPADVLPGMADDAIYVAQAMPWIDPVKEAAGAVALIEANLGSEVEFIRKRGQSPRDVLRQIAEFERQRQALGVKSAGAATSPQEDPEEKGARTRSRAR